MDYEMPSGPLAHFPLNFFSVNASYAVSQHADSPLLNALKYQAAQHPLHIFGSSKRETYGHNLMVATQIRPKANGFFTSTMHKQAYCVTPSNSARTSINITC